MTATWFRFMAKDRSGVWLVAGGGILALSLLGFGAWYWWDVSQSAGRIALFDASRLAQEAASPQGTPAQRDAAHKALGDALARYPRSTAASEAAYLLGNLHYQVRSFEAARVAYQASLKAGARGSLAQLSRLGIGYAWEGQGEHVAALAVYEELLGKLGPSDFLYEDVLLATARAQELLKRHSQALETYRRLLLAIPGSRRAEEVRARLASIEGL